MKSKKKVGNKSSVGGAREGAGRPQGQTKKKISVSIDSESLEKALNKWEGKTSQLVETLIKDYIKPPQNGT